jgi:Sugar (and other) transporter
MTGSIEFMFEAVAYFSVCAFFFWVSKYWHYVMIPTIVLAIIGSTVIALYIPESPRYLVSQFKFDQARKVFSTIYKYNFNKVKR